MTAEHPFAAYVRILGRGKTLSRSLTIEEAEVAMAMILRGEVRPEQLGAFLMLMRVKDVGQEIRAADLVVARNTKKLGFAGQDGIQVIGKKPKAATKVASRTV